MTERLNQEPLKEGETDVLGDVLQTLSLRGTMFFHSDLAAPWGMSLSKTDVPRFHIALSGKCFVASDSQNVHEVNPGEIIMLPTGNSHWIADQPGRKLVSSEQAGKACELDNPLFQTGEITNRLMCGLVRFDEESSHPILNSLPEILHFPKLDNNEPIWMIVKLIDAEVQKTRKHSGTVIDRLTEVLFLKLLGHYVEDNDTADGFFSALRDRRVHQALMLIHQDPAFNWTLSILGEKVGMSRATLVRRFQESMDESPMAYILNWRIMKAYNAIKYTNRSFDNIAESVGFASSRTLSKAFQRHYHCTPHELRQAKSG